MNLMRVAVVVACVMTGTTLRGAPRESVQFNEVLSYGRIQQTDTGAPTPVNPNPTLTHTFTGGYTTTYLTITGHLTRISVNGYFCESTIYVTPPNGGTPFLIQPFKTKWSVLPGGSEDATDADVPAGAFTVPVAPLATAGEWSFLFYERFNDITGADARWDTVTITLNDGTAPAAAPIGPMGHTFTDQTIDQLAGSGFNQTFTLPSGMVAAGVRIRAMGTALYTPGGNVRVTPTNSIRVRVSPPGGAPLADATVFPLYSPSSDIGEVLVSLPANMDSAGEWRVEAFVTAFGYVVDLHTLAVELVPPATPTAVNLGTLVANTPLVGNASVTAAGQTKWFKFTLNTDINAFENRGLEVDTEGSTTVDGTAALNTSLAVYTPTGERLGFDLLDGTASLGSLTFGVDNHPAPGNGQTYNGRDGAAVPPGDYYVAVAAGDTGVSYGTGVFAVTNSSTQTGAVRVNVRLVDPGASLPASIDAGTITGDAEGVARSTTVNVPLDRVTQVKWVKFTLASDATSANGKFVDIDSEPATPDGDPAAGTINDQEIGLYRPDGTFIIGDDDDGSGYHSQLTFGDGVNSRPPYGNGQFGDGRDGELLAGTYYLAACLYDAAFGDTFWNVTTTTATGGGTFQVNFRSNLIPVSPCGQADLGVQGGTAGSDSHLDNNDFVVFINLFFTQSVRADVGVQGGVPGSDGAWDNNDFIVFINLFFDAPVSCH